jgi:predicted RNA-binding Zn-ribbon protein involved in translation (DUF1610 family)
MRSSSTSQADRGAVAPRPEYLFDFIDEVLIRCPECGEAAVVLARSKLCAANPAVRCARCGFNRAGWPGPKVRADAVAKRRCPRCGRWLEKRYHRALAKRRAIVLSCPCKAETVVALQFISVRLGGPHDPYFGYPLWLQKTIGPNVLWAYNRRHLAFLKEYVAAAIRPRTPGANGSLASRLPAWMKKGTRRANLLRAIQALEGRTA